MEKPDEQLPDFFMNEHKNAMENWKEGNIIEHWIDENDCMCIRYQSGNWWHYRIVNSIVEWW